MTRALVYAAASVVFCSSSIALAEESVELSRARFDEGVALVDQGRFEEALVVFRELEQARSHPVLVYNIAWCLSGLERHEEAIETFESYLDQGDDSTERRQAALEELGRLRTLVAPPEPDPEPEETVESETTTDTVGADEALAESTEPERSSRRRLSPALFWGFVGLTAATGATLIGTGAATLNLSHQWQESWIQEDRDRGEALAWVSEGLLIALVCEAIATLVLGLYTDFGGDRPEASGALDEL